MDDVLDDLLLKEYSGDVILGLSFRIYYITCYSIIQFFEYI